jgi:hypothetical protein
VTVIAEEPWNFTVFHRDNEWVITYLRGGIVDVPVSIRLLPEEVSAIRSDSSVAKPLADKMRSNRPEYADREIHPAVWPAKDS